MDYTVYTEGVFLDYRYMMAQGIKPRYAFGFSLSYMTFDYLKLETKSKVNSVSVSFNVKNSGIVDGTDILYLAFSTSAGESKRVLRDFEEEVPLRAGKSKKVEISLSQQDLRYVRYNLTYLKSHSLAGYFSVWDVVSQKWVRPSGRFTVYIGKSVLDTELKGTF